MLIQREKRSVQKCLFFFSVTHFYHVSWDRGCWSLEIWSPGCPNMRYVEDLGPDYMSRAGPVSQAASCAEMTFSSVLHEASQPGWSVDGWCDKPWETGASLILYSHWLKVAEHSFRACISDAIFSTWTKISKNKHAVSRVIILFTQHPHYLCFFAL